MRNVILQVQHSRTRSGQIRACAVAALLGLGAALGDLRLNAAAQEPSAPGDKALDAKIYDQQIRPFLVRHCLGCHGVEKPKGDLRLDRLLPDFADEAGRGRWQAVLKRVKAGEMPPKAKPRPSEKEVQMLSGWISGYRARIRNHGHSCFLCEIVIRSQFHTTYEPEA